MYLPDTGIYGAIDLFGNDLIKQYAFWKTNATFYNAQIISMYWFKQFTGYFHLFLPVDVLLTNTKYISFKYHVYL